MINEYKIEFGDQCSKSSGIAKHYDVDKYIGIKLSRKRNEGCYSQIDIDLTNVNMGFVDLKGDYDQIMMYELSGNYNSAYFLVEAWLEGGAITILNLVQEKCFDGSLDFIIYESMGQILTQYINNLGADHGG